LSVLTRAYFRNGPNAAAPIATTLIQPCWCQCKSGVSG